MIDKILAFLGIHRTALIANISSNVLKALEQEFLGNMDAKHAAIDSFIHILQDYKNQEIANLAVPAAPPIVAPIAPPAA